MRVHLIDNEGTDRGVLGLKEALRLAQDKGMDLVEIAPQASPPKCKIMDYGKWKYENKKKQTKQATVTIKEIQIRPRTDEHDFQVKLRHARRFLESGHKVKINLRFTGREMSRKEKGFDMVNRLIKDLSDISKVETPPKLIDRKVFVVISALPGVKKKPSNPPKKSSQEKKQAPPA